MLKCHRLVGQSLIKCHLLRCLFLKKTCKLFFYKEAVRCAEIMACQMHKICQGMNLLPGNVHCLSRNRDVYPHAAFLQIAADGDVSTDFIACF